MQRGEGKEVRRLKDEIYCACGKLAINKKRMFCEACYRRWMRENGTRMDPPREFCPSREYRDLLTEETLRSLLEYEKRKNKRF